MLFRRIQHPTLLVHRGLFHLVESRNKIKSQTEGANSKTQTKT